LVGRLHATGVNTISLEQLIRESGLSADEWEYSLGELGSDTHVARRLFERNGDMIQTRIDVRQSWTKVVRFFETVCSRMFQGRGSEVSEALLYRVSTPDGDRVRWMSPDDISFLVAVGLRALIEECWSQGISLVGIVKDSSSRYFSRHYYGVMRYLGVYPNIHVPTLPWTDRTLLESIAYQVDPLKAPWSTIEFDSCFMTLHLARDDQQQEQIVGMRGDIVNQERLFARSLGQFFLKRSKSLPLAGHVIFMDRLLQPSWDSNKILQPPIARPQLGTIRPFFIRDESTANVGQQIHMFLLNILCRNLFPEVIGYPDPLHKAGDHGEAVTKEDLRPSRESTGRGPPSRQAET
jgi:hypothetical protein